MSEYKKFDLEAALRGEKVLWQLSSDGRGSEEVTDIMQTKDGNVMVATKNSEGELDCRLFNSDGTYHLHYAPHWLLVMAPKPKRKVKLWVNVYQRRDGAFECCSAWDTKELAVANVSPINRYIATVPIEFEDRG